MTFVEQLSPEAKIFEDRIGREISLVRFDEEKQLLRGWMVLKENEMQAIAISPDKVDQSVLEKIGVWDQVAKETQRNIGLGIQVARQVNQERMAKARAGRKGKEQYSNLPRQLRCSTPDCENETYIAPGILVKKIGLEGLDDEERMKVLEVFLKDYKCAICQPRRRGRVRNSLYADIPRTVKCSGKGCDKECAINPKNVYEQTGGDAKKIKAYCDGYLCRNCNPEWGSWLKGKRGPGKKANPENEGFPKTAKCKGCDKEVHIVPSNIRDKAKKLKVTVEELLKNYKCRSCGGVIKGKARKKRKNRKMVTA